MLDKNQRREYSLKESLELLHDEYFLADESSICQKRQIGSWTIIYDEDEKSLVEWPWRIRKKNHSVSIYHCQRHGSHVIMYYLPRVIAGIQDILTGENIQTDLVVSYRQRPDFESKIVDVRKTNLEVVPLFFSALRRKNTRGYFQRKDGKWVSRIMIQGQSYYLGVYETEEAAFESRVKFVTEHHLEHRIPLEK